MSRWFFAILMLTGSSVLLADTFDLPLRVREARELFDARRYRDAEQALTQIREQFQPLKPSQLDSYLGVLDYLARSISQQGRTENVRALLEERHVLIAQHYDKRGFVFANSMGRLAEALYREGNRTRAINFADYAISLYQRLSPVPSEAIELAQSNRLQYKVSRFSTAMLPMDLSDFYTRCEKLASSATESSGKLMSGYVEVGVDYRPTGEWADYFDVLLSQHQEKTGQSGAHRIFIPHSSEQMRGDLCFVPDRQVPSKPAAENDGVLISAESELD